jgi:hypothetical protein
MFVCRHPGNCQDDKAYHFPGLSMSCPLTKPIRLLVIPLSTQELELS